MAILQAVVQLAIRMIEDLVGRADGCRGGLRLGASPDRQFGAGHRLMPRPAVGQAHHPDDVSQRTPPGCRPAGLDVSIIRMGTNDAGSARGVQSWFGAEDDSAFPTSRGCFVEPEPRFDLESRSSVSPENFSPRVTVNGVS